MVRPRTLLLLACVACDGLLGGAGSALPRGPVTVSTTPVAPGGTVTLSVQIPAPATGDLDVRVVGSLVGEGTEPCVLGGRVCGGLVDPVELGSARFFADVKVTSVDATVPGTATPGGSMWLQAFVSTADQAVASEVLEVTVQAAAVRERAEAAPAEEPTPVPAVGMPKPEPSEAVAVDDCSGAHGEVELATCQARVTGNVQLCEDIPIHNDRLYCFAVARGSAGACAQVMDQGMRARCLQVVGGAASAPTEARRPSRQGGSSERTSSPKNCDGETNPDWQAVCEALATGSAGACVDIGNHDAKLFCYGITRGSRGSCLQVMNESLEAECLQRIGAQ